MTVTINGTSGITTPSLSSNNGVAATNALTGATLNTSGAATIGGILNANGGQIKFPASQNASADANTLDDYEEGTWTPSISGSGGGAATFSVQQGYYTKVGRLVTVNFYIVFGRGTLSGNVSVTGLPFTALNTSQNYSAVATCYWQNFAISKVSVGGYSSPNSTQINFTKADAATQSTGIMAAGDINVGTVTEVLMSLSYQAAA